ncbi:MAG: cation:dicarboxylase symporter family transporter [Acidobacteriia bacterium]|nr:cation:dicarboxylase symporter family transporter [Terriglobia bacterium]
MKRRRFPSLTVQILIGLVIGIFIGWLEPGWGKSIKPMADIFLRMIKMIIAPLIFSTLVIGIAGTGDFRKVGRIGLKAIIYFEIATTVALLIGLVTVNVFKPGQYISQSVTRSSAPPQSASTLIQAHESGSDFLINVFPTSVVDAMAKGNILQLVIFSIFFGLALAAIGEKGQPLISVLNTVAETMFRFTDFVMRFAPLGVMAAIAWTVGDKGLGVLRGYASLVLCFYGALIFFVFVVLFLVCSMIRVPFMRLFKAIREPFTIAFTTASSEAALPTAMEMMERFGCPRDIVGFVLPTGYSFNLDGATLYLSLASIFIAQVFGIPLDIKTQLAMMLTLMLTSKGVAGVPRASLVILAGTVASFNLPLEGVALLLGIDQILDMGRTATNVTGNCVATAVVARWEGVLDDKKMLAFEGGKAAPATASMQTD